MHRLLSRHLSNSFATAEEEGMGNLNRSRNWFFALIFITFLTGSGNNLKLKETLVFKNLAKDVREAEKFRSTRQTIMCSATIPQRCVCVCVGRSVCVVVSDLCHLCTFEMTEEYLLTDLDVRCYVGNTSLPHVGRMAGRRGCQSSYTYPHTNCSLLHK